MKKHINLNTILLIISLVFYGGILYSQVGQTVKDIGALEKEVKEEYVRKDTLILELELVNQNLVSIRKEIQMLNGDF